MGWGFGVGQFVLGLNWIATAFTFQAAMPAWLGWVAVVLLSLYLAVYPMIAAGLAWRFGKDRPLALALALAGSWAITEWLRATMFTGFAWNPIGVTLVDTPLLPVSRFVGTYSLSAIVVGIGSAIWLAGRGRWRESIALLVPIGLLSLVPVTTLAPAGPRQAIRIVQPNIGQDVKWSPDFEAMATARLNALSSPRAERKELIFWPEAAVTSPLSDTRPAAGPFVEMERRLATRTVGADDLLLTGGIALRSSDGRRVDAAANSVFVLGPGGDFVGRYDKSHLVPYGEYLPMRPILSAIGLSRLAPGDSDFIAGPGPGSLPLPDGLSAGFQLCYEIIFSGQVVNRAHRPDFIFNPSNDAWFGACGPPQHLAQARLRASEEGLAGHPIDAHRDQCAGRCARTNCRFPAVEARWNHLVGLAESGRVGRTVRPLRQRHTVIFGRHFAVRGDCAWPEPPLQHRDIKLSLYLPEGPSAPMRNSYLFTSESVSEGHPDKVADQISDAIVDLFLSKDPEARIACETLMTTQRVVLAGEIRGKGIFDETIEAGWAPGIRASEIEQTVRETVKRIGYEQDGFHWKTAAVRKQPARPVGAYRAGRRCQRQQGRRRGRPGHHVRLRRPTRPPI